MPPGTRSPDRPVMDDDPPTTGTSSETRMTGCPKRTMAGDSPDDGTAQCLSSGSSRVASDGSAPRASPHPPLPGSGEAGCPVPPVRHGKGHAPSECCMPHLAAPPDAASDDVTDDPYGEATGDVTVATPGDALGHAATTAPSSLPLRTIPSLTPIVGIGASAGGLEALEALFRRMPVDLGVAYVVIQHLSPHFHSFMDELLTRQTAMPVEVVRDGCIPAADHVYVLPPGKQLEIIRERFALHDKPKDGNGLSKPINTFLSSLALARGRNAAGIVLSGTGTDGASGLESLASRGALTLVQQPESASFDGMPRAAAALCYTATIVTPEDMPRAIADFFSAERAPHAGTTSHLSDEDEATQGIFSLLQQHGGIDFSNYKPATIERRLLRRLKLERHATLADYAEHLRQDPSAVHKLFHDLLIGVTTFFRDGAAFARLENDIMPLLFSALRGNLEIRAWVAGCATGEEAYSLGMLLLEGASRYEWNGRISIFATDVHRASLEQAAEGLYPRDSISALSPERQQRFFLSEGDGFFRVTPELRSLVLFTPHNLLVDPPFTRVDIASCRNLLIYFKQDAQDKAIARLHTALRQGGTLFMGASETPGRLMSAFEPVDTQACLYRKKPESQNAATAPIMHKGVQEGLRSTPGPSQTMERRLLRDYDGILKKYVPDGMLVDEHHAVLHFFGDGAAYVINHEGRTDRPVTDMLQGDLRLALASALQRASTKGETGMFRGISTNRGREPVIIDLEVTPLCESRYESAHYLITFTPSGPARPEAAFAQDGPLECGPGDVIDRTAELEQELERTRANLRDSIEQIHITNEELQTTNQELLSANEELQVTNEELHSINEELYTVNAEFERKNEQLRVLGDEYAHLIDTVPIAIVSLDDRLRIRRYNAPTSRIFHLQPHDVGRPLQQMASTLTSPDGLFEALHGALTEGRSADTEVLLTDGAWFQQRVHAMRSESGVVESVLLTFTDISGIKREEALRQETRSLDEVSRNVPGMVFKLHEDRHGKLSLAYVSGDVEELLGMPAEGLQKGFAALLSTISAGTMEQLAEQVHTARDREDGLDIEFPLTLNGRDRWIHVRATPSPAPDGTTAWYGVAVDASQRRRDAALLGSAVNRYLRILEHAPMLIWRSDTTGACDWFNATWLDFTGRTMEQELGYGWAEGVHPDDFDRCVAIYQEAFARQQTFEMQYRLRRTDGLYRWIMDCGKPLPDLDGTFSGYIGYCYDITDSVNALESMREAGQRAEEANRIKSEFLANVSHELRTPLNGVLGMLQLLDFTPLVSEQKQFVATAIRSGQNLVRLLSDILDLSRIEAGKLVMEDVPCDITMLIEEVFSTFRIEASNKGIELRPSIAPGTPTYVRTDPLRLRQTLFNLVGNAVKFTERGGVDVEISTASTRGDTIVLFCTVRDTGPGIPDDRVVSIFQPFTQIDGSYTRRHSGLGLGLGIVCRLLELFGGCIEVESDPGAGTAMHFAVPTRRARRPQRSEALPEERQHRRACKLHLLVAEDDAVNRVTLTRMLQQLGHSVRAVEDGSKALEALAEEHFDVVFLDIQMPVLDGIGTMQAIRAGDVEGISTTLPIIAVTAHAMEGDRERFISNGANSYIQKPYDFKTLEKVIDAAKL